MGPHFDLVVLGNSILVKARPRLGWGLAGGRVAARGFREGASEGAMPRSDRGVYLCVQCRRGRGSDWGWLETD